MVNEILKSNFIVPSMSLCSSLANNDSEKDVTYRMIVDYPRLNNETIKDIFPLGKIEDLLPRLGEKTTSRHSIFSVITIKLR